MICVKQISDGVWQEIGMQWEVPASECSVVLASAGTGLPPLTPEGALAIASAFGVLIAVAWGIRTAARVIKEL